MRALLFLCLFVPAACGSGEPELLGRSVSEWAESFEPPPTRERQDAREAFCRAGEEALPVVAELFRRLEAPARAQLVLALDQISAPPERVAPFLLRGLFDPAPEVRIQAAWLLGRFAAPDDVVEPLFRAALADEEAAVRYAGVRGIGRIEGRTHPLLPELLAMAERERGYLRGGVLLALARIAPAEESVARVLLTRLEESAAFATLSERDPPREREVMSFHESFGFMLLFLVAPPGEAGAGPSGPDDSMANLRTWFDDEPEPLADVVDAILLAGPPLVPGLTARLGSRNPSLRLVAALTLGKVSDDSGAPELALGGVLGDESAEVRVGAATALLARGARSEAAIRALVEVAADPDAAEIPAASAVGALGHLDPLPAGSRAALLAAGADSRWLVREAGFYALVEAGVDGADAAAVLAPALRADEATRVRYAAVQALLSLEEAAQDCVYALLDASRQPEWEIREPAILCLARLASTSEEARQAVLLVREDEAEEVRKLARKLLAQGETDHLIEQAARAEIAIRLAEE